MSQLEPMLPLDLQSSPAGLSLSGQIADALMRSIRRAQLSSGQKLPSSRSLAQQLQVHRNTVIAAFDDLQAQGYIKSLIGSGTFVSESIPQSLQTGDCEGKLADAKLHLSPAPSLNRWGSIPQGSLALLGGLPDLRTVPTAALARAYRAALKQQPSTLDYQSEFGQPRLISQLQHYLRDTRGVRADSQELLVSRGSQQALHLAARALYRPGSVIAVERCGYAPAWEGFRLAGAQLRAVGTDRQGLITSELEKLCQEQDVSAVYVTPHHQYPTTVTLSGPRRMELLQLARRYDFVVIEDDYDHEFHFEGRPVLPLKSADREARVLLIGTLSKVLAPGLRVGYAVGQSQLIEHMANTRSFIDRQGDHTTELALAYLMEDGELGAHIRRMHRTYRAKREFLIHHLRLLFAEELSFSTPNGGLALWCKILSPLSSTAWAEEAKKQGVLVQAAAPFFFDRRPRPFLRLGFARLNEPELLEALTRLKRAHSTLSKACSSASQTRTRRMRKK